MLVIISVAIPLSFVLTPSATAGADVGAGITELSLAEVAVELKVGSGCDEEWDSLAEADTDDEAAPVPMTEEAVTVAELE